MRPRGHAKSQRVSTCAREDSECEYLDAGVSAKSHSVVPVEDEDGLLAKQSVAKLVVNQVAKQQVNSK